MPATVSYRRDHVTWTGFSLIGVWAMFLYFIGPAAGAIGADLGLSAARTGFIGTALALGLTASAVVGPRAVAAWGRVPALTVVLAGFALAGVLLAVSQTYSLVLLAIAGIGLLGAITANTATATLTDHHPRQAARAITEGNAAASWLGVVSPALLGAFLALPAGWRGGAAVLAVLPMLAAIPARRLPVPLAAGVAGEGSKHLAAKAPIPQVFWAALVVVSMAVAFEFSINFWAASLIRERTGATLAAAATALSAMALGMALGRTFAAALANRYSVGRLLTGFFLLASSGLTTLLLVHSYWGSLAALFCTGLGVSVLFPFAQAQAISLASGGTDRSVALTAIGAGVALGGAPFLLGLLAGGFGVAVALAFGFVIAAVGIGSTLLVAAWQGPPSEMHGNE